ncbi:hypothetical protein P9112_012847 [Eukaryota sp. TZLM1-RC]
MVAPLLEESVDSTCDPIRVAPQGFQKLLVSDLLNDSEICTWLVSSLSESFHSKGWNAKELDSALSSIPVEQVHPHHWQSVLIQPFENVEDQEVLRVITKFSTFKLMKYVTPMVPTLSSLPRQSPCCKTKSSTTVLYITPEFPPQINGGLGEASFHISQHLSESANLRLVIPDSQGSRDLIDEVIRPVSSVFMPQAFMSTYTSYSPYQYVAPVSYMSTYPTAFQHQLFHPHMPYIMNIDQNLVNDCSSEDFDVIHVSDWLTVDLGAAIKRKTGKPLVFHLHSLESDRNPDFPITQISDIESRGIQQSDLIVCVSNYTKDNIVKQHNTVARDKIVVVHNGVNIPKNQTNIDNSAEFKSKYKIPKDKRVVLFVGRFSDQKGLQHFVDIGHSLLRKGNNLCFVLVGDGHLMAWIKERLAKLEISHSFHLLGFLSREDTTNAFKMADCCLMPSVSEPFGLVALESAILGTPVLISRNSGVKEVLESAISLDPSDIEKWVNEVEQLLKNFTKRKQYIKKIRREAKRCTWNLSVSKLLTAYDKLS